MATKPSAQAPVPMAVVSGGPLSYSLLLPLPKAQEFVVALTNAQSESTLVTRDWGAGGNTCAWKPSPGIVQGVELAPLSQAHFAELVLKLGE